MTKLIYRGYDIVDNSDLQNQTGETIGEVTVFLNGDWKAKTNTVEAAQNWVDVEKRKQRGKLG